ncbi:MAG: hypothetical protein H7831_03620 [Magnetococcus sp. WYHC-3]
MSESSDKKAGGLLAGLFGKKKKDGEDVEGVLKDPDAIKVLLRKAVGENNPVHLQLSGKDDVQYFSFFETEWESLEYLDLGQYLLIGPLDPPAGNLKIRSASSIKLLIFTETAILETNLTLIEVIKGRVIKLSFPTLLRQARQKRSTVRVKLEKTWDVNVEVRRPSGVRFKARPYDLSSGGVAWINLSEVPLIADGSKVLLTFFGKTLGAEVSVEGVILGRFFKEEQDGSRARFLVANSNQALKIGEMVALLQREQLKKRVQLFE